VPTWLAVLLVVVVIAGNYYAIRAFKSLSPHGRERRARLLLLLGPWAGRRYFTEEGWRYRNRAWFILGIWVAAAVIWFLVTLPQN
jgi:hypothetical protein